MMRVTVNQRVERKRTEERILLEDLLEAWKDSMMFAAKKTTLTFHQFWASINLK